MLDETQEAPEGEAEDTAVDVADAGGDDAVDLADLGGEADTADEPAVTAEELMEIPDAPEVPGREGLTEAHAADAEGLTEGHRVDPAELGAQAAAEDAAAGGPEPVEDDGDA